MKILCSDDGVSESLGFVLIAMVLITAMAAVLMIGYPIYQQSINNAHMQNMAEGFYLLSSNINKVALYQSPIQSSELKLYGGTLSLHDDGVIMLNYKYHDDVTGNDLWSTPTDPVHRSIILSPHRILEYSSSNEKIAYIMGGVLRKEGSSSVVIKDPIAYHYYDSNNIPTTVVLPYVEFNDDSLGAIGGTGISRIEVRHPYYSEWESSTSFSEAERIDGVKEIQIDFSSEYNDALLSYFTRIDSGNNANDESDNLGFSRVYVDKDNVAVQSGHILLNKVYTNPVTLYIPHSSLTLIMT